MNIQLLFEPRDLWIGVFWDVKERLVDAVTRKRKAAPLIRVYICLLPTLPLRVQFIARLWREKTIYPTPLSDAGYAGD